MATTNEREEILAMLASGKITAEEAADLLNALGRNKTEAGQSAATEETQAAEKTTVTPVAEAHSSAGGEKTGVASNGKKPNWLHIRVSDLKTGNRKVSVNVPIGFLKFGLRLGRRLAPEMEGLNWEEVGAYLAESGDGTLVDVSDETSGEHVQIYVD